MMALDFADNNARFVNFGSGASLDNLDTFTYMLWIYPVGMDAAGAGSGMLAKGTGGAESRRSLEHRSTVVDMGLFGVVDRAVADAGSESIADTLVDDTWQCIAMTFNLTAGIELFCGTLTTSIAEVTYNTQAVGAGATGDNSAQNLYCGNYGAGNFGGFEGYIAWVGIWNVVLTLGQIRVQQFHPHKTTGCVLFTHLGFNGTGTQPDWSGNANTGTVTGAAVADHVPLGPPFWSTPLVGPRLMRIPRYGFTNFQVPGIV